jgi:hypothetical protein
MEVALTFKSGQHEGSAASHGLPAPNRVTHRAEPFVVFGLSKKLAVVGVGRRSLHGAPFFI